MLISPLWPSSLLLTAALAQAQTPACPNNLRTTYPAPVPADGWHARVVANKEMKQPRSILFDTEGALLVLDQNVGVLRMTLEDHGGSCVVVKNVTSVVRDENVSALSLSSLIVLKGGELIRAAKGWTTVLRIRPSASR